jgi:radical SAM protein with 4Fe4S-binding SPASM domain
VSLPPPYLISWNVTKRCNLLCAHCYLDATDSGVDTVSTDEAMRITDEVASLTPGAMLVLTGGEPLLRPDIFDIISRAADLGLNPVLGTNATMLTKEVCSRLLDAGIKGAGVSLDSLSPALHDRFRGMDGAWKKTLTGMEALRAFNIPFQMQFTITKDNRDEIERAASFAIERGALAINFFFLVCTGRGQKATDLTPEEYEGALEDIVKAEEDFGAQVMVRARCAPHIVRVAERVNPRSPLVKGATCGCVAGKGYLRISPEGLVTACPYIPANERSPSVLKTSLKEIWENDPSFLRLRAPALTGRCADCGYKDSCGGCRARAAAANGDIMGEDPWCVYEPEGGLKKETPKTTAPRWSPETQERLEKIPVFLRPMIKKGLEKYAVSKGIETITPELMAELRQKAGKP